MARPDLPAEPLHGLGDLALALGGSEDSFTGKLLQLIAKADPSNRDRLRLGFPRVVRAWELWMATSPTPTASDLLAALDRTGFVDPRLYSYGPVTDPPHPDWTIIKSEVPNGG